jgi:hypothetical protein
LSSFKILILSYGKQKVHSIGRHILSAHLISIFPNSD